MVTPPYYKNNFSLRDAANRHKRIRTEFRAILAARTGQ